MIRPSFDLAHEQVRGPAAPAGAIASTGDGAL